MVTTDKTTWVSNLNISLGSASQVEHAQNYIYQVKQLFVAAGWSVARSSNSASVSASDLWVNPATDIVYHTTGNRSWIVLDAPSNYAVHTAYSVLLEAYGTSGANPLNFSLYTSTATWTGGAINQRPTTTGTASAAQNVGTAYNQTSDVAVQTYLNTWRVGGDVLWVVKQGSTMTYAKFAAVIDASNSRHTTNRLLFLYDGGSPFNNMAGIGYATNHTSVLTVLTTCRATLAGLWLNGQDSTGNVGYFPVFATCNGSTQVTARDYGRLFDIWGVSNNTPDSATDAADGDAIRLMTVGGIALPTTFSQTPML